MEVGESKAGIGLQDSEQDMCSFGDCYGLFQRCTDLDVQNKRTGLT